jgi:plastocyanin
VPDENPAKALEPVPAKKALGFVPDERPSPLHHNWLWARIDGWLKYFESASDELLAQALEFNAIVGSAPGCTHATLAAAIAAAAPGWKILVTESANIAARVALNVADIEILFKPGVVYTKTGDTVCFEYTSARIKVRGGRFVGYTVAGNIVHRYMAGADYCHLLESIFAVGTDTDVDDAAVAAGKKPIVANTIVEV